MIAWARNVCKHNSHFSFFHHTERERSASYRNGSKDASYCGVKRNNASSEKASFTIFADAVSSENISESIKIKTENGFYLKALFPTRVGKGK